MTDEFDTILLNLLACVLTRMFPSSRSRPRAEKSVRLSLCLRIPEMYAKSRDQSAYGHDTLLHDPLLDIVVRFLRDTDVEVSSKAYVTTMALLHKRLLNKSAVETRLCPLIVQLSRQAIDNPANQVDYETNTIEVGLNVRIVSVSVLHDCALDCDCFGVVDGGCGVVC